MNETQLLFYGDDKPAEELYDLEADPHEIQNLAKDPKFASELARHRKLLTDWIAKTGDQGQQTEDEGGLIQVHYEWGDQCVNPEYDSVKQLGIEPKVSPARANADAKAAKLLREAIESPTRKNTKP